MAPVVWAIMASFMPAPEFTHFPPYIIAHALTVSNYVTLFKTIPMLQYILNSAIVVVAISACVAVTSLFGGYVFAVVDWPGREIAFWCVLASLFIPFQVLVVPLFAMMKEFGWLNSYQALVVPFTVSPFGILLVRNYLRNVPLEYIEAARVDGAGEWRIVATIALPLVRPALSALTIFTFLGQWDNLLWPAIVITSGDRYTLPLGITDLAHDFITSPNLTIAAAIAALVPTVAVFAIFQRKFIEGAALSGLK